MDIGFIQNTEMKILGTVSSYPRKNDCYRVECKNTKKDTIFVVEYMPITKYNLIIALRECDLPDDKLKNLLFTIEANNEYIYEVATDECNMSNSEDI